MTQRHCIRNINPTKVRHEKIRAEDLMLDNRKNIDIFEPTTVFKSNINRIPENSEEETLEVPNAITIDSIIYNELISALEKYRDMELNEMEE